MGTSGAKVKAPDQWNSSGYKIRAIDLPVPIKIHLKFYIFE